ncbi:MAG: DNA primase [Bacteroidales bacterium]|nr:DNA primase [Bacteroidales bacterium]
MIKPETIQTIFETARIDEVVGDFVNLKKRGVNMIGLCPFHDEKTPSFTVSPAKGIYKCFGCGKGGNAVNFIMEHEHYSYPEALKYLAKKYGIEIIEEKQTAEQLQALDEKESLFNVTAFAQKYFSDNLFNKDEGKAIGLSYFKSKRNYNEATIKKFELGYCIDKWADFTEHATKNAYKLKHLVKSGLTVAKNDNHFDRFAARVMFPIHNLTGKVIGFGGRILSSEKSKAKYVNSPESEIYNKSKVLYGIYFSKNSIINKDNCLLVEGYTDVISLYQAGIENVVSSSGTSLTKDQIKLIKRYSKNITILYDGDPAGIKASFRGIDMILEEGLNVRIVLFPDGEDPDSYSMNHSSSEVEKFLNDNAVDFITFKTNLLLEETKNDPIKKAGLIKEIVNTIALIPDGIFRATYVKECSSLMDTPEQTLMNELNKIIRKRFSDKNKFVREVIVPEQDVISIEAKTLEFENILENQERELIRMLLMYGTKDIFFTEINEDNRNVEVAIKVAEYITSDIKNDELSFNNPDYQIIFDEIASDIDKGVFHDDRYFINHHNENILKIAVDILSSRYELSENWKKHRILVKTETNMLKYAITSTLFSLKAKKLDLLITENQKEMKAATTEEDLLILQKKHIELKKTSLLINKELSRIIIK